MLLLTPCLLFGQQDTASAGMKFDFGFSKAKNLHLWPILTVTTEQNFKRIDILSGVYDYQKHTSNKPQTQTGDPGFVKSHLFPVFWYSNRYGKSVRILSLYYPSLFHYESCIADSTTKYNLLELAPGFSFISLTRSPQGVFSENNLFFLLWYKNDKKRLQSHLVLFPFLWNYRSEHSNYFTLFPLFSFGHHFADRKYFALTPFFWHISGSEYHRNILLPLFYEKLSGQGEYQKHNAVLFPFYFSFKSHDHNNKVLFPMFFSLKNKYYTSLTLFPFFSVGHNANTSASHFAVTPFFWHSEDSTGYHNTLFPLWWNGRHYHYGTYDHYNVLFPFYWSLNSECGHTYYPAEDEYKRHDTIYKSSSRVFFPFYWNLKHRGYNSITIFPIYSKGQSPDGRKSHYSYGGLFWHFKKTDRFQNVFFPFWWSGRTDSKYEHARYQVLFPIWWSFHDSIHDRTSLIDPNTFSNNHVFFPFVWSLKNEKRSSFTVFPFYSKGQSVDSLHTYLLISPLCGIITEKSKHVTYLFPLFNYKTTTETQNLNLLLFLYQYEHGPGRKAIHILGPLCAYEKDSSKTDSLGGYSKKTAFHIAPVFWYKKTEHTHLISVLPFYSCRRDTASLIKHVLWPLYRSKEIFGVSTYRSLLWQVFTSEKDVNGDRGTRFLFRVYSNIHKDGGTELSVFPFVYKTTKKDGSYYKSYLLSFYNFTKHKIENTNYYYQEERIFWLLRLRSNYKNLKEKGVVTKRKGLK